MSNTARAHDPNRPAYSLADLEALDPKAPASGPERRFLCPLCGDSKSKDAAHRSLTANVDTGAWHCHRCGASGKLKDYWTNPDPNRPRYGNPKEAARARRLALSTLRPMAPPVAEALDTTQPEDETTAPDATQWRRYLADLQPLGGTPGAEYLAGRGIPLEVAQCANVQYHPRFMGGAAVIFPILDRSGALVAINGRYIVPHTPKTRSIGPKATGAFRAPWWPPTRPDGTRPAPYDPLNRDIPAVVICEAPIDALSLAAAGCPALALVGTTGPDWLHLVAGLRRAILAFDADEAGDAAAAKLAEHLAQYGARCERLRPNGYKDWNEALQIPGMADVVMMRYRPGAHRRFLTPFWV